MNVAVFPFLALAPVYQLHNLFTDADTGAAGSTPSRHTACVRLSGRQGRTIIVNMYKQGMLQCPHERAMRRGPRPVPASPERGSRACSVQIWVFQPLHSSSFLPQPRSFILLGHSPIHNHHHRLLLLLRSSPPPPPPPPRRSFAAGRQLAQAGRTVVATIHQVPLCAMKDTEVLYIY